MKATVAAAAAALLSGVSAVNVHRRHVHEGFHLEKKGQSNDTCGCTTIYSTYYGEATRMLITGLLCRAWHRPAAAPGLPAPGLPGSLTNTL